MKVIGLHGYPGVGKDEAAKPLLEMGWERIAFADALREAALAINPIVAATFWGGIVRLKSLVEALGWDNAKRENSEVRELLQRVGTEGGRRVHGEKCWLEIVHRKINDLPEDCPGVVLTDVRFPNEAAFIRAIGGTIVQITRPGCGPVNGHTSETPLRADVRVHNAWDVDSLHMSMRRLAES